MADDDVTDLTEEGGESEAAGKGKKKKEKTPKLPKAGKEPKEKKEKAPKEKGGSAGGIILIMIIVLIILIGGFGAALYFDVFDAREITAEIVTQPLLDIIIWLDPGYSTINQRLIEEQAEQEQWFREQSGKMDEREEFIILQEDALTAREQQVERRANELNRREEQILAMYERTVPLYRRDDRTEQEMEDMLSLSRLYTNMSPEAAAERLVALHDPRDVAAILYYMGERNAASILAAFDVRFAAEITEILLYY